MFAGPGSLEVESHAQGWVLSRWEGPDAASVVGHKITMDSDKSIRAVFATAPKPATGSDVDSKPKCLAIYS